MCISHVNPSRSGYGELADAGGIENALEPVELAHANLVNAIGAVAERAVASAQSGISACRCRAAKWDINRCILTIGIRARC